MERTLTPNVASTTKETAFNPGPSSSKLSTSNTTYTFCQPSTSTLTSSGLSSSPLPSTSAGYSSLPSTSSGHSRSHLPSTSGVNSRAHLPSTSGVLSRALLPSTSGVLSRANLPSTSGVLSKAHLPSTSGVHSRTHLPSTSGVHSRAHLPSTSGINSRAHLPSTSTGRSRSPLPSTSTGRSRSPLPSTSTGRSRSPLPSTSTGRSKSPLPSTSTGRSTSPLPSTSTGPPNSPLSSTLTETEPEPSTSSSTAENSGTKRPGSEIIHHIVSKYLKSRNYSTAGAYQNENMELTEDKLKFVFNRMIDLDLSRGNTFLFSNAICLTNNPGLVDLQFAKFVQFVENQPIEIKSELFQLLAPLICHLYLELLKGKDYKPAINFLRKYAPLIATIDDTVIPSEIPDDNKSDSEPDEEVTIVVDLVRDDGNQDDTKDGNDEENGENKNKKDDVIVIEDKKDDVIVIEDKKDDEIVIEDQDDEIIIEDKEDDEIVIEDKDDDVIVIEDKNENEYVDRIEDCPDESESENENEIEIEIENSNPNENSNGKKKEEEKAPENNNEEEDEDDDDDNISEASVSSQIRFINESSGDMVHEYFKEVINTLSKCQHIRKINNYENIVLLRSSKLTIDISSKSLDELSLFLQNRGHIIILNILHIWINFNIIDIGNDIDECTSLVLDNMTPTEPIYKADPGNPNVSCLPSDDSKKDTTTQQKRNKIRIDLRKVFFSNVKLMKVERPMRTIYISDPGKSFTSSSIDSNDCHLAAGFDNSIIKLWELNTSFCGGKNLYKSFKNSTCGFEFRNVDANSDEIESDYDYDSDTEIQNVHKYDGKPISYLRDYSIRQRKKQFKQNKCSENTFNEFGGISLRGHNRGVTDVMFSSYFPLLLSTSKDKTMRAWKASNFETVGIYKGHTYPIWCLNQSPLEVQVATGSKDLTARLWSLEFEFPLITYVGHTQDVTCLGFHANGAYLATGSNDQSVRLWSVTTGKLLRVYPDCKLPISTIAFSPNGKLLAAGGEETSIRIFDLAAGKQLLELKEHPTGVSYITWNKKSTKLAASCYDGSVHVWKVRFITESDGATLKFDPNETGVSSWNLPHLRRSTKILFDENDVLTCVGGF